jgi:hypothetical protein
VFQHQRPVVGLQLSRAKCGQPRLPAGFPFVINNGL